MGWKAIENECVLGSEKKQTNGYSEKENKEDGVRDEWRENLLRKWLSWLLKSWWLEAKLQDIIGLEMCIFREKKVLLKREANQLSAVPLIHVWICIIGFYMEKEQLWKLSRIAKWLVKTSSYFQTNHPKLISLSLGLSVQPPGKG